MPTDTEIWERACERVGATVRSEYCSRQGDRREHCDNHPDLPAPLGSSEAAMRMLEWMAAEIEVPMRDDDTGKIVQVPERRGLPELWFDEDYHWHCRPYGYANVSRHRELPLAIAHAVCALPEHAKENE